ncbi:MAG TPA: TonB-dependent receptor [Xanthobacteraceae bacterium]|nr:TonB-dependent receptor [Xanthobacteraceae bacterium]
MFLNRVLAFAVPLTVLNCSQVLAQSGNSAGGGTVLSEITVSANKRDQTLDRIDGAVSVRTGDELAAAGVTSVADLEKVFPSLVIRTRGNRAYANFTVRGMSSPDYYNPSVQIYVDGVPQDSAYFTQELVDVERVEFLRGPQGTLYGRNAFGGVINIISRKAREARVAGTGTVTNRTVGGEIAATVVPVPDTLFVDIAARALHNRGQITDITTGQEGIDRSDVAHGRIALRYAPAGGPFDAAASFSQENLRTREEIYLLEPLLKQRQYVSALQGPYPLLDRKASTGALSWNYRVGEYTLTGITGFQSIDMQRDISGQSFPETKQNVTQELRLAFGGSGPLSGVVGAYFEDVRFTRDTQGFPGFTGPSHNLVTGRGAAVFGEATYRLTERLAVTGGARFSYDEAAIDFAQAAGPFVPAFGFTNTAHFNGVQPKVSLGYQLTDELRVYGLVSQGYKPGGFNHTVTSILDMDPYKPETALNIEVGSKASLFAGRLDVSSAVYRIKAKDKQIYVGMVPFQVIRNVGEATSAGVEMEARLKATDRLTISGTANVGRSVFDTYVDPVTSARYDGNRLPYAPDVTASLSARYVIEQTFVPGEVAIAARANGFSRMYFNEANTLSQPAYVTFDAALEIGLTNAVLLKVFAENITDEVYRTSSFLFGQLGPNDVRSTIGQGRLVGASVKGRF